MNNMQYEEPDGMKEIYGKGFFVESACSDLLFEVLEGGEVLIIDKEAKLKDSDLVYVRINGKGKFRIYREIGGYKYLLLFDKNSEVITYPPELMDAEIVWIIKWRVTWF